MRFFFLLLINVHVLVCTLDAICNPMQQELRFYESFSNNTKGWKQAGFSRILSGFYHINSGNKRFNLIAPVPGWDIKKDFVIETTFKKLLAQNKKAIFSVGIGNYHGRAKKIIFRMGPYFNKWAVIDHEFGGNWDFEKADALSIPLPQKQLRLKIIKKGNDLVYVVNDQELISTSLLDTDISGGFFYEAYRNTSISIDELSITEISTLQEDEDMELVTNNESEELLDSEKKDDDPKKEQKSVLLDVIPRKSTKNEYGIAVVIGNKDYQNPDVPSVDFALNDAQAMRKYIVDVLGFQEGNVIYIENATKANFEAVFGNSDYHKGKLFNYVRSGKSDVFIYYSGHGAPDPESKKGYFVPIDCDPSLVRLNGYSQDLLYENITRIEYKSLTMVIDACFSGSSDKGMLIKNISPIFITTENKPKTLQNSLILNSSSGDQVSSWYPEMGHSMFTYFLIKGLLGEADRDKNKSVQVMELNDYLTDEVSYMARRLNSRDQTPEVSGDIDFTFTY